MEGQNPFIRFDREEEDKDSFSDPQFSPTGSEDAHGLSKLINRGSRKIRKEPKPNISKNYGNRQPEVSSLRGTLNYADDGLPNREEEASSPSSLINKIYGYEDDYYTPKDQLWVPGTSAFQSQILQQTERQPGNLGSMPSSFGNIADNARMREDQDFAIKKKTHDFSNNKERLAAGTGGDIRAENNQLKARKTYDNFSALPRIEEGSNGSRDYQAMNENANQPKESYSAARINIPYYGSADLVKMEEDVTIFLEDGLWNESSIQEEFPSQELRKNDQNLHSSNRPEKPLKRRDSPDEYLPRTELKPKQSSVRPVMSRAHPSASHSKDAYPKTDAAKAFCTILDSFWMNCLIKELNSQPHPEFNKKSHHRRWTTITESEMKQWIGLVYFMGIEMKTQLRDYWTVDPAEEKFSIRKLMSRERFIQIYKCFPGLLGDETGPTEEDAVINQFLAMILENSRKHYQSSKNLTLGCSTAIFCGRNNLKANKPKKIPVVNRTKAYMAVEASTGFVMSCQLRNVKEDANYVTSRTEVIMELLSPFEESHYSVYMGSEYSTSELFTRLLNKGIKACGKIDIERLELPVIVSKKIAELQEYTCRKYSFSNFTVGVWKVEKGTAYILSTVHSPSKAESIFDRFEAKNWPVEAMIADYNANVNGVTKYDEMMLRYTNTPRNANLGARIGFFYFLLEVAMINSYILYMVKQQEKGMGEVLHQKDFRLEVIQYLFGNTELAAHLVRQLKTGGRPIMRMVEKYKPPVKIEDPNICSICTRGLPKKSAKTMYMCQKCYMSVCRRCCFEDTPH